MQTTLPDVSFLKVHPCPLCGEQPLVERKDGIVEVFCDNGHAELCTKSNSSVLGVAIEHWNDDAQAIYFLNENGVEIAV